ncbi:hypothetical protein [Rickettsia tamurae]|nr:hypothetical protein [Rickettsia tamurae]
MLFFCILCCYNVIPRLDRGIQSFLIFFWIPWLSHGMTISRE